MTGVPEVSFWPLEEAHLRQLHGWLQQPHVREFWDDGDRTPEQVWASFFEERDVEAFVFSVGGRAAGYIQAYAVGLDSDFTAFRAPAGQTWGIDLFIGETDLLGRGHAVPVIEAFIGRLRAVHPDLQRVLIDPETRNGRAVHVYRRAGFTLLAVLEHQGLHLQLMARDLLPGPPL